MLTPPQPETIIIKLFERVQVGKDKTEVSNRIKRVK